MEQQHGETKGVEYPRGRGYGHDYMRGGEVFGGYGYSERDEYHRPRGDLTVGRDGSSGNDVPDNMRQANDSDEQFPQDERAGGWDVPHDLDDTAMFPLPTLEPLNPPRDAAPSAQDGSAAPVPQIEHTFGDTGGNRVHSRSYYVTQAQLQQRLYGLKAERDVSSEE